MPTLLTPTPVGPIATSSTVLILAKDRKNRRPLSAARAQVTKRLSSVELPACFAEATSASYARLLTKPGKRRSPADKRDVRRLARQELAIANRVLP